MSKLLQENGYEGRPKRFDNSLRIEYSKGELKLTHGKTRKKGMTFIFESPPYHIILNTWKLF